MRKFVLALIYLTTLLSAGYALKCYRCTSNTIDVCRKELTSEHETTCDNPSPGQIAFCYYRVDQNIKFKAKENITANCDFVKKDVQLDKDHLSQCAAPSKNYTVKECVACTKDLCNSAPVSIITNLLPTIFLPFIYFVIEFVSH